MPLLCLVRATAFYEWGTVNGKKRRHRFRFAGRKTYLVMLLIAQMIPLEAMVIPVYLMFRPLAPGDHTLSLSGSIDGIGFSIANTHHLHVQPGVDDDRHDRDDHRGEESRDRD